MRLTSERREALQELLRLNREIEAQAEEETSGNRVVPPTFTVKGE